MFSPYTCKCVPVISFATNLFQLELTSLGFNLTILDVAPWIKQPIKTSVVFANISNLWRKARRLLKQMVLAHGTTPPPFVEGIKALWNSPPITSEKTNGTVTEIHYKPRNEEDQMEQHEKIHSWDSQKAKVNWGEEVNSFGKPFRILAGIHTNDGTVLTHVRWLSWKNTCGKHLIKLTPEAIHINIAPYRSGPKVRKF